MRTPFTKGVTIDAPHSKDLDDAVWAERQGDEWDINVVISDVASAVAKGSTFDDIAFGRVESRYTAERTYPMLPRRISEDKGSLLEGKERAGLRIQMRLDNSLQPVALPELSLVTFTSQKRFAYSDIPGILSAEEGEWKPLMTTLANLASALVDKRRSLGAFVLYDLNTGWTTTEEGELHRLKDTQETIGHLIIQEMMILTNSEISRLCAEKEIPIPWRNHTARSHADDRQQLMERIQAAVSQPLEHIDLVRKQVHMTMNRAEYGPTIQGHYGLNLPAYTHSTSPIRRFADLVTQRQLVAHIQGKPLPYSYHEVAQVCLHTNAKIDAVRTATSDYWKGAVADKAKERLQNGDLKHLGTKAFERVNKVTSRGRVFSPVFAEEFSRRLREGTLPLLDLYVILVEAPKGDEEHAADWRELRQEVIDILASEPWAAVSILMQCQNIAGWSEPKYKVETVGPDHQARFEVVAKVYKKKDQEVRSKKIVATSTKRAKQFAALDVLARAVKLNPPEVPEPEAAHLDTSKVPQPGSNNVSSLQEFAQNQGNSVPTYSFDRTGGVDHAPEFKATCHLGDTAVESTRSYIGKKAAKQDAAGQMLLHLGK